MIDTLSLLLGYLLGQVFAFMVVRIIIYYSK
jgi:uncharacterized membrane protein YqaE (UPF0057 family)